MPRHNKYRKGSTITNWTELALNLQQNRWVYWGNRPKHPGWLRSMHFQVLDQAINRGDLREAIPTQLYICVHAHDCQHPEGCIAYKSHEFVAGICHPPSPCSYSGRTQWCVPVDEYLQPIPEESCSQQD